MNIERILRR